MEKVLDYPRDQVTQDTGWNCGPATVQTIVRAATGRLLSESSIAARMGTTVNGTNHISSLAAVLNAEVGGAYRTVDIGGNDATQAQRDTLWEHLVRSINAGRGVAANIIAPPTNYPRAAYTSDTSLRYGGGTVYHYIALMGVAEDSAGRYVWWADSGFSPYGCWITLEQTASLIAGKGYAWPYDSPPATLEKEELDMNAVDRITKYFSDFITGYLGPQIDALQEVWRQLRGPKGEGWPQLGKNDKGQNLTLVDAIAAIRHDIAAQGRDIADLRKELKEKK